MPDRPAPFNTPSQPRLANPPKLTRSLPVMDERALLARLIEGPVSGDALARVIGQTRAAVWKRIQALREAGVPIEAQPGRGYQLTQPFDLLDSDTLIAALPAPVRARIASLEVDWIVDSTNSELLRRISPAGGEADVLLAERQTRGRGRRGREWSSPLAAHLYLSLSRSFSGGLARLSGLSLVAGIATVEALHELGFPMVRLKWPNDLVVVGANGELQKLGGVLVEGGGEHAGPARAVIGLGLNVRMPVLISGAGVASVIDQPWCDLSQLSPATPSRNALAATILKHWVPLLDGFDQTGLTPLLARYAAVDAIAGQPIRLQAENCGMAGVALGLAEDGSLRVRLEDGGERRFHSGEVSIRRTAGAD